MAKDDKTVEPENEPQASVVDDLGGPGEPAPPHSWIGIGIGFAVVISALIIGLVMAIGFFQSRTVNLVPATEALSQALAETLEQNHVPKQSIKTHPFESRHDANAKWNFYLVDVEAPATLNVEGVEKLIRRDMEEKHVAVTGSLTDRGSEGLSLQLANHEFALVRVTQAAAAAAQRVYTPPVAAAAPPPVVEIAPQAPPETAPAAPAVATPEMNADELPLDSINLDEADLGQPHVQPGAPGGDLSKPRAAIIVDDGGYGGPVTDTVLQLSPKMTLAILPNTPHATETAERAEKLGFEVMLHMPMEATGAKDNFPGYIAVSMRSSQMRGLTDAALDQIPGAVGINNHTGSKFTASEPAMKAFLQGMKDKPLYFIDSHTASDSVAYTAAQKMGVKSAANNLFLDNKAEPEAIRAQFAKFVALCKTQGHGIAIGHFRSHTAKVLTEEVPKLAAEGITLVHVSELVK